VTAESKDAPARHRGNRYGRSQTARLAILEAADDLLVERGFAGVTMEGIAARAGVAKQTIYRWWNTKADVLLDAFLQDMAEGMPEVDHGNLERDLRAYLRSLSVLLGESETGATFRALIGHGLLDPAFGERLRAECLDAERQRHRMMLERAVDRGELAADLDLDAEADHLVGPVFYRALISGEPLDEAFIDRSLSAFFAYNPPVHR
jgi:AcrR family transcriptional regulator